MRDVLHDSGEKKFRFLQDTENAKFSVIMGLYNKVLFYFYKNNIP